MLNESEIIETLRQNFNVPGGIGDDGAIFPFSETEDYVISKDLLVEDIHFKIKYMDPESLAHKALHVNLSDLAAMGAKASYILLGGSIPKGRESYAHDFLRAFTRACKACDVVLIGGDTTASPHKLFISVTAIGRAEKSHLKFRSQAKEGDIVCVAGNLGHAHVGLMALEKGCEGLITFKEAFLKPKALLREGLWLGSQKGVSSMMDISDGLYIDLKRLCQASGGAAEIELESLPISSDFQAACHTLKLDPREVQLTGGEDYGLLMTINCQNFQSIVNAFESSFGYPLKAVGKILKEPLGNVILTQSGHDVPFVFKPFSHFGEI